MSDHGGGGHDAHGGGHGAHGDHAKEDPIKKFYEMREKVDKALATTEHHHRKAFTEAEASVLLKDGLIDRDLLKKKEYQEKFAYAITDSYLSAAKDYFKVGKDAKGDDMWENRLIHAYAGTTKAQMLDAVRTAKNKFNYSHFHENFEGQHMEALRKQLTPLASAHITDDNIEAILDHVGVKDKIDKSKIRHYHAIGLLENFRSTKAIGKDVLNKIVEDYAITKPEYRSDYVKEEKGHGAHGGGHH